MGGMGSHRGAFRDRTRLNPQGKRLTLPAAGIGRRKEPRQKRGARQEAVLTTRWEVTGAWTSAVASARPLGLFCKDHSGCEAHKDCKEGGK